jgi:transcriptional regulator with XRE-family HTH domain
MALPMTTDPTDDYGDYVRAAVAEEVRSAMARKRISGAELARRIHKSVAWVSRRTSLTPSQTFDFVELGEVARALGVTVEELIPVRIMRCNTDWSLTSPALTCVNDVLGQMELAFVPERALALASS